MIKKMIKKILKATLPEAMNKRIRRLVFVKNMLSDYYYDYRRYQKHSATFSTKKNNQMLGKIIAHYHVIEKGLSFNEIRLGFSKDIIKSLVTLLQVYSNNNYEIQNTQYLTAISVVKKYIEFHEKNNFDVSELKRMFQRIKLPIVCNMGGAIELKKEEIDSKRLLDFKQMALSRHSIRDFTEENVDIKVIEEAIKIAQKSPSVCNRQTSRVYIVSSKLDIENYLKYQNGNRGYGHKINKLIIVTSDLNLFEGAVERNQSFVDGGIFSMSLLYALHYLGLGSVTLNWCTTKERDREFRKVSQIRDNENIILMIGIGHIPQNFKVTKSERNDISDIISYI